MRMILAGFQGWVLPARSRSRSMRTVDTAITVTGTLLVAVTLLLLRS